MQVPHTKLVRCTPCLCNELIAAFGVIRLSYSGLLEMEPISKLAA